MVVPLLRLTYEQALALYLKMPDPNLNSVACHTGLAKQVSMGSGGAGTGSAGALPPASAGPPGGAASRPV